MLLEVVLALVLIMCSNQCMASDLKIFPSEVADAKLNKTICIICTSKLNLTDVEWHHQKIGSTQDRTVYLDGSVYTAYKERFSVSYNENQRECRLNIANLNSTDAGKYSCKHNSVTASVELIVFEIYPSNESCFVPDEYSKAIIGGKPCNIAPAIVPISCNMKCYGNKVPVMVWKDEYKNITLDSSLSKNDGNHITSSTVQLTAVSTTKITCTIQFVAPDITSNISWTKGVEVLALSNSSNEYNTNCSSLNQTCGKIVENCRPQWTLPNGTFITSSETLVLTDFGSGEYECNNVCYIRRQNCVIRQRKVKHFCDTDSPSEAGTSATAVIVGVVITIIVVAVAVAVVVVVVVVVSKRRKDKERQIEITEETPPGVNANAEEQEQMEQEQMEQQQMAFKPLMTTNSVLA